MREQERLQELRSELTRLERAGRKADTRVLTLGIPEVDGRLPGGGLSAGALHEVTGGGPDIEHAAAAASFVAGLLSRDTGRVFWAAERFDVYTPGLEAAGLDAGRIIFIEAARPAAVLLVMEECLRTPGLCGVVGEFGGRLSLTASRRLQLAAESSGTPAFAVRRSRKHGDPAFDEATAAATRWRISGVPSPPPLDWSPGTPGLGRARWLLELRRCRGGEGASWVVEGFDEAGRISLASDLPDGQAAQTRFAGAAGF